MSELRVGMTVVVKLNPDDPGESYVPMFVGKRGLVSAKITDPRDGLGGCSTTDPMYKVRFDAAVEIDEGHMVEEDIFWPEELEVVA